MQSHGRRRAALVAAALLGLTAVLVAAGAAAGRSGGSPRPFTPTPETVPADADTYVAADTPTSNFGTATRLRVDSSPDTRSYLRFDLSSLGGSILSASLKITPTVSLSAGFEVHGVADNSWVESGTGGMTYDNAPPVDATAAATSGAVTANTAVSLDITQLALAAEGGQLSIALVPRSATQLPFGSRESTIPPELDLTVDPNLEAPVNVTLPSVAEQQERTPPVAGDQLAADPGTWTNSPGTFHYAWQACDSSLASCRSIGTDSQVITIGSTTVGSVVRVQVTASNQAGSGQATSAATAAVVAQNLGHDPVVMAAGDISCGVQSTGSSCAQGATSDLILANSPDLVLPLGDDQYECGALSDYQTKYDPSWGRLKSISRPVTGNHEYTTSSVSTDQCYQAPTGAPGFYTYFGSLGSPLDAFCTVNCKGYYSYDIGAWHLIALNSNCTRIGDCSTGDPQVTWLQNDLAAHAGQCILAYWHHPRWTSGQELPSPFMDTIYRVLYNAHADLILNGHDHDYERFAPLDPNGNVDPANGIREIIAGTGGRNLTTFVSVQAGSELRDANTFGVLRLVLHPTGYEWRFLPALGATFTDSGSQPCHIARNADRTPPAAPGRLNATSVTSTRVDLSWQPASDNVGVVAYRIYRDNRLIATVGNIVGYSDNGVRPRTKYTYQVSAVDASGNESQRSRGTFVRTNNPEAAPPLFADGFETGTLDHWTNVTGSVTVDSSTRASGFFSGHVVANGGSANAWNQFSPSVNELWLRARFKLNSLSTQANLFRLRTSGATAGASSSVLTVYLTPTGTLAYRNETTATNVVSTTPISSGTWHTLLLHVRLGDASTGLVETTLDGARISTLTAPQSLQASPIGRVQIGDASSGHTFDANFDDVLVSPVAPG